MCRASDAKHADGEATQHVSSRTTSRPGHTSVPVYGQNNNNNNIDTNNVSDSVVSVYRDPMQRLRHRNMLTWRDHWQPTSTNRLPNADQNYSNGKYPNDSLFYMYVYVGIGNMRRLCLTPSTPAVPNCCCSNRLAPYWSNTPFLPRDAMLARY